MLHYVIISHTSKLQEKGGNYGIMNNLALVHGKGSNIINLFDFRRRKLMALTEITAKKSIDGVDKTAGFAYDFGDTLEVARKKFGDEIIFSNFKANAKITAQAAIRRMLEDKKTPEEIAAKMKDWKPGVALERVIDPVSALLGRWDSYSDEEKSAILKKLKK